MIDVNRLSYMASRRQKKLKIRPRTGIKSSRAPETAKFSTPASWIC